ncbi:rRNA maturation RNase YbeY [Aliiglaciecola sp. 2_MG-2023]|uniref:rRNA maturation RNase YbeY n=1 Tax=unclassified Aliiglaciecola TaxID=2593648 RepID=UPI0026E18287|nr:MULTISPECIES: rRNA maturation RNase YbeY [unclassified Aliiglaciecola]MDO6711664.1 rRNA maturation RNase YbeY [Aliiglaciecola sp. 2_MG-2023]MDO6752735.1 rRNA maturation RNase YbeY [Aliiglaciecola sp. 1_MG-2023]
MNIDLDIQIACENNNLPTAQQFEQWVKFALADQQIDETELTIRIVTPEESQNLNATYREKDKPTNILSFPFEAPAEIKLNLLGDLVVCADIVEKEAEQQNKLLSDHWAHMIVHGSLHLLGFDHVDDQDAEIMESLEVQILTKLGIDDPYQDH